MSVVSLSPSQLRNNPPAPASDVASILAAMRGLEARLGDKARRGIDEASILAHAILLDRAGARRTLSQMCNRGLVQPGSRSAWYGAQWALTDAGRRHPLARVPRQVPTGRIYYRDPATGQLRYTRGRFERWEPAPEGWRAIFRRRRSVLAVPEQLLTRESRAALPARSGA